MPQLLEERAAPSSSAGVTQSGLKYPVLPLATSPKSPLDSTEITEQISPRNWD